MDIYLILATVDEDPDSAWTIGAWDEYRMDGDYDGYVDFLNKARKEHGAENVRVVRATLDHSVVRRAWLVPSCDLSDARPATI